MLHSVQYMRAIAAILVVFHHAAWKGEQYSTNPLHWFHVGSIGVDLFFVISGFIMCYTVDKKKVDFWNFLKARFFRIIPLYWVLTSLALVVYLIFPEKVNSSGGVTDVLASFTLIPSEGKYLINNGWTLSYEFLFYFIFATCLTLNTSGKYLLPCAIMITACTIGFYSGEVNYLVSFFTSVYLLEFVFGIFAFYVSKRVSANFYAGVSLIAVSVVMVFIVNKNLSLMEPNRIIQFGVPSLLFFVGMVLIEPIFSLKSNRKLSRTLKALGDSSYSLYLFHPFVLVACSIVLSFLGLAEYGWIFVGILVVTSLVSGHICYLVLESPISNLIKKKANRNPEKLGKSAF